MLKPFVTLFVLVAALIAPLSAPAAELRFGAFPSSDPDKLLAVMQELGGYLTEKLGEPVNVVITRDYSETAARLGEGSLDLAWLGALNYVQVVDEVPGTRYLATYVNRSVATGIVAPYYHSVVVVAANSGIDTLADLKGKRFAFTDPGSTSGYAYPSYLLRKSGIDPNHDLAKVFFLKRHDRIVEALLSGAVDAGALADDVYYGIRERYGDALKVIAQSDPIPMVAVVASRRLDAKIAARVQEALAALPPDHPFCRKMREVFGWDAAGFQIHDDALYDSVRAVYGRR